MEASCSLGESSYELLQDILSSTTADVSIRPANAVTSKEEFYAKIVFNRSPEIKKLCRPCLNSLWDVINDTDREYLKQSQQYANATRQFSYSDTQQGGDQHDDEGVHDMISDILVAEDEIARLKQEERSHKAQLETLQQDIADIEHEIFEHSTSLNALDQTTQDSEDSLLEILSLAATTENELEHLLKNQISLFSFQWKPLSVPATCPDAASTQLLVVNGLRLAFAPLSSENLNWAEICAAWACVSTAILCYQNDNRLTAATGGSDDLAGAAPLYSFRIVPLRNCAVLVRCDRDRDSQHQQHNSFKLLCSEHSEPALLLTDDDGDNSWTGHDSKRNISAIGVEYANALVALSIVVLETIAFCHMPEKLYGKPVLLQLLAIGQVGGGRQEDLTWPDTSAIILQLFKSRRACKQLTNELAAVIYAIMSP
jgi:hypothetical protein